MANYQGINKKTLKNKSVNIYVRFKHNGKNYGTKNFTKIFGCKTEKSAFEKLQEVKVLLSQNKNPFENKSLILNDIWDKKLLTVDWKENTKKHYINYYDIVIRNTLGNKSIHKITANDILSLKNDYKNKSIIYQNRIKSLINPLMNDALIKGEISSNPLLIIKNKVPPTAQSIAEKVVDGELKIARKLYKILNDNKFKYLSKNYHQKIDSNDETNSFFLLLLLTAHRFGELLQLKKSDIYDKKIIAPKEITKSNISYEYPFPKELKKYINTINENEKLFPNLNRSIISVRFKKLVQNANIQFVNNKTITPHDIRRIFTSILVKNKVDVTLIDFALEHKTRGVMAHYLHYNYNAKRKVFKKYWKLIRELS